MSQLESELAHADVFAAYREGALFPGGFPLNNTSTGYEASRIIKAGSGRLFGLAGYSSRTSAQFILVFDASSVPVTGATSVLQIPVSAAASFSVYYGSIGRWFLRGIVVCTSSTSPTLTIGSADTFFDAQFI